MKHTFIFFIFQLILMNGCITLTASEKSRAIIAQSHHDQRLKIAVGVYFREFGILSQRPQNYDIVTSMENKQAIFCSLPAYTQLLHSIQSWFEDQKRKNARPQDNIDNIWWRDYTCNALIDYLQEQYTNNRSKAVKARYVTIMALSKPHIALPLELCRKIAASIEPQVFKTDILLMLRISSSGDPRKNLPNDLVNNFRHLYYDEI